MIKFKKTDLNKTLFELRIAAGVVTNDDIVFLSNEKKIWAYNTWFDCTGIATALSSSLLTTLDNKYSAINHTHSQYLTGITKAQVEAVLTGNITSHVHNQYLTAHQSLASYVPFSKQSMATVNNTNLNPQFINIENETLISNYQAHWSLINLGSYSGGNFRSQIAMPYEAGVTNELFIRTADGSTWHGWNRVLHDGNYTSYLTWNNLQGKPSTFTPNEHYHNLITLNQGNLPYATYGTYGGIFQTSDGNAEGGLWFNRLKILHENADGYYTELGMSFTGTEGVYYRRLIAGSLSAWKRLAFVSELSNYYTKAEADSKYLAAGSGSSGLPRNDIRQSSSASNLAYFIPFDPSPILVDLNNDIYPGENPYNRTGSVTSFTYDPELYYNVSERRLTVGGNLHMSEGLIYSQDVYGLTIRTMKYLEFNVGSTFTSNKAMTVSSDIRKKSNVAEISKEDLDKLENVKYKSFNWKDDEGGQKQYGVIAQELLEADIPGLVIEPKSEDKFYSVNYNSLYAMEIARLKELVKQLLEEVEQLKTLNK